eukprot:Skav228426  [mRNA]  locus=scaffold1325:309531:316044:- [translate_table: standard]
MSRKVALKDEDDISGSDEEVQERNAFNYSTMFFQINGLSDTQSAGLSTMFQLSCAIGNVLGGLIGDAMARRCPNHGRAFTANISVACGIPCVFFIFMSTGQPFAPLKHREAYYAAFLVAMGLTATWCCVGVNWPILSELLGAVGEVLVS